MKQKILDFLKNKYKTLGFSDKAFDGVAEFLAKTITKEEDIETGTAGVEIILKGLQGDIDKRVTEAIATTKKEFDNKKDDDKTNPDPSKKKDDTPDWAKQILTGTQALQAKVEQLEKRDQQNAQLSSIKAKLSEAKVPEKFYKTLINGKDFKDDAELEALTTEIVTSWKEVEQDFADKGLGQHTKPLLGNANAEGVSANVAKYVADKVKPASETALGGKKLVE